MPRLNAFTNRILVGKGLRRTFTIPPLGLYIIAPNNSSGSFNPYTSADNGATWTERTNPRTAGTASSTIVEILNLGNGTLFALTSDYDTSFSTFDRQVSGYLTSTNGTTWTNAGTFARTDIPAGQTRWNIFTKAAHNGSGLIVIMGAEASVTSTSYCKISQNYGSTWTTVNFGSGTKYQPWALKYVNNRFVALLTIPSTSSVRFATSTDGITWTFFTPSVGNSTLSDPLQDFDYSPTLGLYVATRQPTSAESLNQVAYSSNLTSWTSSTLANYYDARVAWGANKFVVRGYYTVSGEDAGGGTYQQVGDDRTVNYSSNGTTWTGSGAVLPQGSGYGSQGIHESLAYAGNYFWTIASSTQLLGSDITRVPPTFIARSSDGLTWTKLNGPSTTGLYGGIVRYV